MRLVPNRYVFLDKPSVAKKVRAKLAHVSPPVKGLAEDAKSAETDPKFASILTNMYVDDDRITARAGFQKAVTCAGATAVEHLIGYYGTPQKLAAATNGTWCDASTGSVIKSGFTSNDWHWTSFANLGDTVYTVAVNGNDGVWSWDGLTRADGPTVTVTKLGKATSPATNAVVTVAAADIAKFKDGDPITITGGDAGHSNANGSQRITKVNTVPNTFELVGVNSSGWGGDQTTGTMTAKVSGSFVKEAVKPPAGNTWLQINDLSIVVAHQNRLFFADETNLAVYYLPLQSKYGELSVLPLNAIFRRGGTIKALNTWTLDGGMGMDDQLAVFTDNGEVAIYSGVDPATDFTLVGVYRFEAPMSKWSTVNYGGELYVLQTTGLTPMSTVLKSGREGTEAADKTVVTKFIRFAFQYRDNPGWELFFNPYSGRAMCNVPLGGGNYQQMVRNMAKPAWAEWKGVPARTWGWIAPYIYFGDDLGNIYRMHSSIQNDDGKPINIDVQMAWNQFRTPAIKQFKMILPYIVTDGYPKPTIDMKVDFDTSPPFNLPEISGADPLSATWNTATWDVDWWVAGTNNWTNWTGVSGLGRVGAIRMTAAIYNTSFSITGWDVLYEEGSIFG